MTPQERALATVTEYWRAAAIRDYAAGEKVMAKNVTRLGPFNDPGDKVQGRDAYTAFIRSIQEKMSAYRNETHFLLPSPDARKVVLQCTEYPTMDGREHQFPLCIIFDINDQWLIEKVDIYWKNPPGAANEWVRIDKNTLT